MLPCRHLCHSWDLEFGGPCEPALRGLAKVAPIYVGLVLSLANVINMICVQCFLKTVSYRMKRETDIFKWWEIPVKFVCSSGGTQPSQCCSLLQGFSGSAKTLNVHSIVLKVK